MCYKDKRTRHGQSTFFLSWFLSLIQTIWWKTILKYHCESSIFTTNSCLYEASDERSLVLVVVWHLVYFCLLDDLSCSFQSLSSMRPLSRSWHTTPSSSLSVWILLFWGTRSLSVLIPFPFRYWGCSPTAWPSTSESPFVLMTEQLPSLISSF